MERDMADANRHDPIQGEVIHVYDGIEEADNELPLWWLGTFYGAILFTIAYWLYYQTLGIGPDPRQQYAAALEARSSSTGEPTDELLEAMVHDPEDVESGRRVYTALCVVCHGERGYGNIGPNHTEGFWIHGGAPTSIFHSNRDGVANAGMPAWGPVLGPDSTQDVATYVLTLRGTNVEGKPPQGDAWPPAAP
jgi:cytochrome c oxidase cbb3-type subunit 3